MKQAQKIIKYLAIGFGIFLTINIIGWIVFGVCSLMGINQIGNIMGRNVEMITYSEEYQDIENIKLDIKYAELTIKSGETLKVEAEKVNEDWKIKQDGKTLKISNVGKSWGLYNETPVLIIYVPETMKLEKTELDFGAGRADIQYLESRIVDLDFGAGKVTMSNIKAERADIECGAGEVIIENADLNNLKAEAGVGRLEYSGEIKGKSKIDCGVGEIELKLIGGADNYTFSLDRGIGEMSLNGESIKTDTNIGNGNSYIEIDGGVGAVRIKTNE